MLHAKADGHLKKSLIVVHDRKLGAINHRGIIAKERALNPRESSEETDRMMKLRVGKGGRVDE